MPRIAVIVTGTAWLGVLGCVPGPGNPGASTSSSGTQSAEATTDAPVEPQCAVAVCGDGEVGRDEACDDANTDDADGCTAQCQRDVPVLESIVPRSVWAARVDGDGSVLVVSGSPYALARIAPDGSTLWSTALAGGEGTVRVASLAAASELAVVGSVRVDGQWVGATWRFDADGGAGPRLDDPAGRDYVGGALAENGDAVLIIGSLQSFGSAIERAHADGTAVWSHDVGAELALQAVAVGPGDIIHAVGGAPGPTGEAAVVRADAAGTASIFVSPPEFPNGYFHSVASDGEGGAVALGVASRSPMIARILADDTIAWVSACASEDAGTAGVVVESGRVVVLGRRSAEPDCGDVCAGATWPWVAQLDLDGTLLAIDTSTSILGAQQLPSEAVLGAGRTDTGDLRIVGAGPESTAFIARVRW